MAVENWEMPAIGAGAAFLGSIPQMIEARRLKKERERLLQEGPGGFTPIEQEQMAAARARAASALAPGYAQEMEGIAQQQADTLAAAKRGSTTGSNMLNVLSRMNAQGQAARRNLAMRGAAAQRQAQSELGSMSMNADARRQARLQSWEADLAEMDAARRKYATEPFMAPLKGAMAFMPAEGIKFTKGTPKTPDTPSPYKRFAEIPSQFSEKEQMYNPYAGQNAAMMKMAPQTADMGPGATPPPMNLMGQPQMLSVPQSQMAGFNDQLNMAENIGYNPFTHLDPRGKIDKLEVQVPQGRPPMVSTIPNITQQGFYSNPYSKLGGDNSRFTYNPDGTVEVLGSKGQRSKGNYKVDRNGRPQIFNLD